MEKLTPKPVNAMSNDYEPYCTKCKRYESRPEWVQKAQCSLCYGPLVPGPHTAYE
jgi:hypothetical protein